ncbi:class I SAM-dependent methyltransferase [Heyndrickxia vini]|uniref:Methyltransferase domain-containing protein n=1 Tax=Heyndrickxia vini TaxID=1476025 RepID=A0ABX7E3K7_9BACI|nr:methyltransferase domain-containing protein [Heyndrickxia vini]QQZ09875.1 methyltransferase domain-containing protein [Heyndrickxia vini]
MAGHRFKPEKAEKLLDPKRQELIPPEKVIELLDIQNGDIIADLGAGNGYLTLPLAKQTNETIYAVDIEPKMLDLLKGRAEQEGYQNIQYIQSDLENIQLEDHSVNKAVIAFVMHEVPDMKKAISECKRILKANGRLTILEWEAVESEIGPPLFERIPSGDLKQFLLENGFHSTVVSLNQSVYAASIDMY